MRITGDRYDGKRIKKLDLNTVVTPYILEDRTSAQEYYKLEFDYVENPLTVVIKAFSDMYEKYPQLNSFVIGKKYFARRWFDVTVGKNKIRITAEDGIKDIADKLDTEIAEKPQNIFRKLLSKLPRSVHGWWWKLIWFLDRWGALPRGIIKRSRYHTSLFINDFLEASFTPPYSHLYEYGTASQIISVGKKADRLVIKITVDTRICDREIYIKGIDELKILLEKRGQKDV